MKNSLSIGHIVRGRHLRMVVAGSALLGSFALWSGLQLQPAGAAKQATSGSPVKLMSISDQTDPSGGSETEPEIAASAAATVKAMNAQGGINGRPIKLYTCDAQTNPNQTANCARQAVSDGVVAVVASYSENSGLIPPILQPAGIAYMSSYPTASDELTSSISYPTTATNAALVGEGWIAGKECKSPVLITEQLPTAAFNVKLIRTGVQSQGKKLKKVVITPSNTTDYTNEATQALSVNPDCIVLYGNQLWTEALDPALTQAGATQRIIGYNSQSIGVPIDQKAPQLTKNGIVVSPIKLYSSPLWKPYKAAMKKYANPKYDYDSFGPNAAYVNLLVVRNILKSIPKGTSITATSFLSALRKSSAVPAGGLANPYDFTKIFPVKAYAHTFNPYVNYSLVKGPSGPKSIVPFPGLPQFVNMGPTLVKALQ